MPNIYLVLPNIYQCCPIYIKRCCPTYICSPIYMKIYIGYTYWTTLIYIGVHDISIGYIYWVPFVLPNIYKKVLSNIYSALPNIYTQYTYVLSNIHLGKYWGKLIYILDCSIYIYQVSILHIVSIYILGATPIYIGYIYWTTYMYIGHIYWVPFFKNIYIGCQYILDNMHAPNIYMGVVQ